MSEVTFGTRSPTTIKPVHVPKTPNPVAIPTVKLHGPKDSQEPDNHRNHRNPCTSHSLSSSTAAKEPQKSTSKPCPERA